MRLKHIAALCLGVLLIMPVFGGCKDKENGNGKVPDVLPQFTEVTEGEKIVEMTIKDYGVIKIRFFKEQAPKAVENFVTHCENGYYDGVNFHRVYKDFMIQGGDPEGDGTGGESIWGKGFRVEASNALYNFRGALSMARTQDPNSNGSQFFIVQSGQTYTDEELDQTEEYKKKLAKQSGLEYIQAIDKAREKYKEVGGYPSLDGSYTVFGQVFEGMDVVDKIADCEVSYSSTGELSVPVQPIVIESTKVVEYKK